MRVLHTQVEGFGLTLEGKALAWFQTLDLTLVDSQESLEKDFISAFSRMGFKHNLVGQINSFQQKDDEYVRDCVSRLKQLYIRCPDDEKPSQSRLISIFLEGLKNKMLHAHLYAKKRSTFYKCCLDAMDYDDNFEISFDSKAGSLKSSSAKTSSSNSGIDEDRLAERIIQKLGHVQRPPQPFRQHGFASQQSTSGPYACGICAGPHPTEKCASYMPGANQPSTKHWCLVCKWNTTHPTQDCMHIARWAKE